MSNGEYQVLVIGAAALDMKVRIQETEIKRGESNPAHVRTAWGGVGRNIAENLVRLGAGVQFITALGGDEVGRNLLKHLHSLGIETEATLVLENRETPAYVGLHRQEALWMAFDDMRIAQEITPEHLERHQALFQEADMICLDANPSVPALETIFALARRYEIPVCVDPTTAALAPKLRPFLAEIEALTPSLKEAEALLGYELPTSDAILHGTRTLAQHLGVRLAIITQGAEGLSYATADESGRLPPFEAEVVDPTGTGDALTAAVAYGLLEDLPPSEAVRLGLAAAAQTILCKETVCPYLDLSILYERLVV
ncbi:MAG: carbohydrate kinase family protein [Anaerolineae bacterium]